MSCEDHLASLHPSPLCCTTATVSLECPPLLTTDYYSYSPDEASTSTNVCEYPGFPRLFVTMELSS